MIDTVKIYTEIDFNLYNQIYNKSIIKTSYSKSSGVVFYEIVNDHLDGSYDSKLSVRVGCGSKYQFTEKGYFIEIEGSYHKIMFGYNSHNGFYNLNKISLNLIELVENAYNIKLPNLSSWYLQRVDIAICYDLKSQENVKSYINSLSRCNYPRRNAKFFYDESIYLSGTSSTLKIYNKLLEFRKHDIKKFIDTDFDLINYLNTIQGFVRFECEIKKKLLKKIKEEKHIKIIDITYNDLKQIWSDEFMKIIKFVKNDLEIVRNREDVLKRLKEYCKPAKAMRLYNFYCAIQLNGENVIKSQISRSTFYDNIKELKNYKIDFSQSYRVEKEEMFYFNPFEYQEVV